MRKYTCQFAVEQPAIAQVDAYSVGDAKLLLSDDQNNVLAEMDQVLAGTADQPARKSMQAVLVPGSNYLVGLSSFSGGFGGEVAIHATLRWIQQKDIERVVVAAELTSGGTVIIEAGQMRAFRFDGDRLFESAAFDGVLLKRGRGGELSSQASAMPFLLPEDAVLIADASLDSTLALTEATAGDPLIEGAALEKQPPLSNVRLHLEPITSGTATIRLSGLTADLDLGVLTADGVQLGTSGAGGTADDSVSVEVSAGKQYIVRVSALGTSGYDLSADPG